MVQFFVLLQLNVRHSRSPSLGSVRSGINNEAHKVKLLFATLRNLNVLTFYLSNSLMPAIYIIDQFLQSSHFWCCHNQKFIAIFMIIIKVSDKGIMVFGIQIFIKLKNNSALYSKIYIYLAFFRFTRVSITILNSFSIITFWY